MAVFNIDNNGNVTLQFNVQELVYTDCGHREGMEEETGLYKFANTIAHIVEHKPSNYSLDANKYLKMMGLHKYLVTSSDWNKLTFFALNENIVRSMNAHHRNVVVRENKKWYKEG